jgi:3-oxoadipate enol-lactonase
VADIIVAEEEAQGAFERYPSMRERRREAIMAMNRDGIPSAIREVVEDPPLTDVEPIRSVAAPSLVVGQEGDQAHRAEVARELAENLPNSELILFDGPLAMLEGLPQLTQRVARFLGEGA